LANRGIDLSMGRERAFLMHRKVVEHLTQALPVAALGASLGEARRLMSDKQTTSIVVVDDDRNYRGMLTQQQVSGLPDDHDLSAIVLSSSQPLFTERTSIWDAMQVMRGYLGEAIAVADHDSGRYLGAIPESAVINAYLDESERLKREEHEI